MEKYLARNWLCCCVVGLAAALLWGQTIRYDFVWDDGLYITQNDSIRALSNIPKFFYQKDLQSAEKPSISYRPIRNVVYAVLFGMGGKAEPQAWLYHLANVLCHAANAGLLYLVALLLCEKSAGELTATSRLASLFVALGFAANPVVSEVVCWAKSLDDLLAAFFVFASAWTLLKWNGGWRNYIVAVALFGLAVFSKESAAPYAVAAFFLLYGIQRLPLRRSATLTLPFLAVVFVFLLCQRLVMGRTSQCPPLSGSYRQTLVDMLPVVPEYLRLLCGLPPFCVDYNYMVGAPPHPFISGAVLSGVVVLLVSAGLTIWLWLRRPEWRMSAFGLLWVALFLLPVSNIIPMMQYMAERFLYLPLVGFLLALGGVLLRLAPKSSLATGVPAVALLIFWMAASLDRMPVWRDELTLFVSTEMAHPGIKRVERNAVNAIINLPQIAAGKATSHLTPAQAAPIIATLQNALRLYPENDILTAYLGLTEAKAGQWQTATALLERATRQHPTSAERWYDLASVYHLTGQQPKARQACAESLRLDPNYAAAKRLEQELSAETERRN